MIHFTLLLALLPLDCRVDLAFGLSKRNKETLRLVSETLVVELSRMLGRLIGALCVSDIPALFECGGIRIQ